MTRSTTWSPSGIEDVEFVETLEVLEVSGHDGHVVPVFGEAKRPLARFFAEHSEPGSRYDKLFALVHLTRQASYITGAQPVAREGRS